MKLTKQQAKKYCDVKWKYAERTGCNYYELNDWLQEQHFEIYILNSGCGYCEKYYNAELYDCEKCPLAKLWKKSCEDFMSLFDIWYDSESYEERKKIAGKIRKDIKRS